MAGLTKNQLAEMVVKLRAEKMELEAHLFELLQEKWLCFEGDKKHQLKKHTSHFKGRVKKIRKLLNDPRTAWKVIDGGKGGL